LTQLEEIFKVFGAELIDLFFIVHDRLKAFLRELALEYFFFDASGRQESVGEASFLLTISPATSGCLLVNGWIPIWIE
jgi:hypothetical protein